METNKKYFNRLAGGAMLLAGAMAFAACSSDEDFADAVNPGAGATGETVKTQFSIAVPGASSIDKRLSEAIVQGQATPVFRGMHNILLLPFSSKSVSGLAGTDNIPEDYIELTAIAATGGLQTTGNYKVYNDVEVATGVDYFLFYGEADETENTTSKDNGSLITPFESASWLATTSTLADISFELEGILGNGSVSEAQAAYADMLTFISKATDWNANGTAEDVKAYYTSFTSLKAGSAASIKAALQDLYGAMKSSRVGSTSQAVKDSVCKRIEVFYSATEDQTSSGNYTLAAKEGSRIKAYETFPANLGLPDGSMQLTFSNDAFAYTAPQSTGSTILGQTAYADFVYPASLFYTKATPIRVSDQTKASNGAYSGVSSWNDVINTTFSSCDSVVKTTTQSIILRKPVDYAVASLNLYVRFDDQDIHDNGANWPSTPSTPIGERTVVIPTEGFPLTGILIGGQQAVGWDFKTKDGQKEKTIYDASTKNAAVLKSAAAPSDPTAYTLALETKGESSEKVNFALEMVNASGNIFVGKDGIVPAGGKFYLVGQLEATADHTKVFEQDHKTVARVTITSLQNAYNCIPDLRSPKLELGLAVNLEWQKGLEANVTID